MIELPLYLAFVVATSILMLIPGPNGALIIANSVAYGTRYGFVPVVLPILGLLWIRRVVT